jgi:hypothetical protein
VDALFEGLQLEEHLSPNRHVGVYAIVNKMKGQGTWSQSAAAASPSKGANSVNSREKRSRDPG